MRKKLTRIPRAAVRYTITPMEEREPIAQALNEEATGTDAHAEYIARVHEDDGRNIWLWCCVEVSAQLGALQGCSYLGHCAYKDEADFIAGGHYEQMQAEALQDLEAQLDNILHEIRRPSIFERVRTWFSSHSLTLAVSAALWVYPVAVLAWSTFVTFRPK